MSKALAFAAGIAVVIAALLFLFSPVTTDPVPGTPGDNPEAGNPHTDTGETHAPGVANAGVPDNVPRWPDPEATAALPARPDSPSRNARPVIALWRTDGDPEKTEVDGFPAIRLKGDPEAAASLHVGQQLALQLPELDRTLTARLDSTHNQLNDIQVFRGPVSGGHEDDNVVVTRGKKSTYVVISTREGVYSAVIDNTTGDTTLTSETDIQGNLAGEDDAIPVPGVDQAPPSD
ncbi:hypothetical protein [Marinobacter sp.]|uniref:hypothetical protein n=1 Tax=Marinobacter sp. TaxID=50741 RepID=UPI0035692A0C